MAITRRFNSSVVIDGRTETGSVEVSGGGASALNEAIPNASTNLELTFELDVSECKSIWIVSDQDILLETNDGTTPDFAVSLLAGIPFVWHESSYLPNPIEDDITSLFATNASGSTANLVIEAQYDPTP